MNDPIEGAKLSPLQVCALWSELIQTQIINKHGKESYLLEALSDYDFGARPLSTAMKYAMMLTSSDEIRGDQRVSLAVDGSIIGTENVSKKYIDQLNKAVEEVSKRIPNGEPSEPLTTVHEVFVEFELYFAPLIQGACGKPETPIGKFSDEN